MVRLMDRADEMRRLESFLDLGHLLSVMYMTFTLVCGLSVYLLLPVPLFVSPLSPFAPPSFSPPYPPSPPPNLPGSDFLSIHLHEEVSLNFLFLSLFLFFVLCLFKCACFALYSTCVRFDLVKRPEVTLCG